MYKHSHNSYWNENQIQDALSNNCNIIETDVIYLNKKVMMSHSWRPFECMCYGEIDSYIDFFKYYKGNTNLYFYLELKTSNRKVIPILVEELKQLKNPNVILWIDGADKFGRRENARSLYNNLINEGVSCYFYPIIKDFVKKEGIEVVDLFKDKVWYKKLNHF